MTDDDYRLRALELALRQLEIERKSHDRVAVADLQSWLYTRIKGETVSAEKPRGKAKAADKSPEIFG